MTFFLKIRIFLILIIIGSNLFSNEIAFNNYGDDLSLRNNEEFREFITQAVINQPDFKEIIAMKINIILIIESVELIDFQQYRLA